MSDISTVACNHIGSSAIRPNAACFVMAGAVAGNGFERVPILARSRSGRWIEKWESVNKLRKFRLKTIPPEHPLRDRLRTSAPPEYLSYLVAKQGQQK